jgi:mannitol-1-phosphate/altronate dehydrogenase
MLSRILSFRKTIYQDAVEVARECLCLQVSLKVTENGSFNVYSRSQEYKFTPEGLVRRTGNAKVSRREAGSEPLSYQVLFLARILTSKRLHRAVLISCDAL